MEADIIKRAFELASEGKSLNEIRSKLSTEGYSNVDGHLRGRSIRQDLNRLLKAQKAAGKQEPD